MCQRDYTFQAEVKIFDCMGHIIWFGWWRSPS